MKDIVTASARVVVMADKARDMLINVYGADPGKIDVIAHGIPDVPLASARAAKERLGFTDRKVILTFGLMSPNKGIETRIDAMPEIVRCAPDALYVVMGATHPLLQAEDGEQYRDPLIARVRDLRSDTSSVGTE